MVCIIMRLSLISLTASHVRPTEEEGSQVEGRGQEEEEGVCTAGLQNKLLPKITCLSTFTHALRTWEEHLFGVTETTYGDVEQKQKVM